MALIVEDGTGVSGADSYPSVAEIDTYWTNRPHSPLAAVWLALTTAAKEGCAREGTAFLDANYGRDYLGIRRSSSQGLLFPRSEAYDEADFPLPGRPMALVYAVAELAARAASAPLSEDAPRGGRIKSKTETVGPITESITYADAAPSETAYGAVVGIIEPLLRRSRQSGPGDAWAWR